MSGVVWMKVISAVVGRQEPGGETGIVGCIVLIDDGIAAAFAVSEKPVELLPPHLLFGRPVVSCLVRGQRGTEELDMSPVSFG